MKKLR